MFALRPIPPPTTKYPKAIIPLDFPLNEAIIPLDFILNEAIIPLDFFQYVDYQLAGRIIGILPLYAVWRLPDLPLPD